MADPKVQVITQCENWLAVAPQLGFQDFEIAIIDTLFPDRSNPSYQEEVLLSLLKHFFEKNKGDMTMLLQLVDKVECNNSHTELQPPVGKENLVSNEL